MSIRHSSIITRVVLLACAGVMACGESAVEPATGGLIQAPNSLAAARGSDKIKAPVLRRTSKLKDDEVVCTMVPVSGKTVSLAKSGLTVTFNQKSVSRDTFLCLVARSGDEVTYSFYPHGLQFDRPITVEQSLAGTAAEKDASLAATVFFGYLENDVDGDVDRNGVGTIAQAFSTYVRAQSANRGFAPVSPTARFSTDHFSGYMVSTGRTSYTTVELN